MKRLSLAITQIKARYDVVVVGSGYGGGVAASRLSRAGQNVCVLERGKEFLPGEFPDTLSSAIPEFQLDTAVKKFGAATALYDMRVNEDMNVFVGCGLGGTSLVNANVSLKAESWVLDDPAWPQSIRAEAQAGDDSDLALGYNRASAMLKPATWPGQTLAKTRAQQQSADVVEGEFKLTPINVTYVDGVNHVGVEQSACNGCGDCVSGCNVGAKNTTAMNYLPDAVNHGAEIFCETKVTHIEKSGDHWKVYYQPLSLQREIFDAPLCFVVADTVVLAAGTLGSSEIMLRSRDRGLTVSSRLGRGFTGNGDVLAFGYNCDQEINGIGFGTGDEHDIVGPCITSVIDARAGAGAEGMVIEEGSLPGLLAPLLPAMFSAAAGLTGEDTDTGLLDRLQEKMRMLESSFRGARHGAVDNTQTYLVMSHDDGEGVLNLENDRLRIDWPGVGQQSVFSTISARLKKATTALGGTYIPNPLWNKLTGHDLVTVHPLGGCGMADDAAQGVVNDRCQVFSGSSGDDVHEGLYVCDGSIVPRCLGVNPLLTISALAERACHLMAKAKGWDEGYSDHSVSVGSNATAKLGIQFTETMRGHMSLDAALDFSAAEVDGKQQDQSFAFTLTVSSDDLDTMLSQREHRAQMIGTVDAPALSARPLMAVDGQFQLFVRDPNVVGRRLMDYRMRLVDESGRGYFFHGYKSVDDDKGLDIWPDTTSLFITLYDGEDDQSPLLGRGILHIEPADFARQMTTMKARNAESKLQALKAVASFGGFFAGALAQVYGGPLAPFTVYDPDSPERESRALRVGESEQYAVITDDGVEIMLTRYRPVNATARSKGPVLLAHGLGVSSAIFSTDTIDTNLLEYLLEGDYEVWLLDYRASIALPAAADRFSADEIARYDYPAAVAKILSVSGADDLQVVAHCFGGCTFSMAMLSGLQGVRSAVISQVATHYEGTVLGKLKTGLHLPSLLDKLGVDSLTAYRDKHANWLERLYDNALRLYPQEFEELTNSPVDKRIAFMYGQLWELDQLNSATHDNLHELFGVANIEAFEHLALMMRKGHALSKKGEEVYLPQAQKMAIPIRFIHGAENQTFLPKGTELAVDYLTQANGGELYDIKMIPDYGHIDCIFGKNASEDVFPLIREHLDRN